MKGDEIVGTVGNPGPKPSRERVAGASEGVGTPRLSGVLSGTGRPFCRETLVRDMPHPTGAALQGTLCE